MWIWFTDGHLLPYTGKEKVHYSYNTQRRMPVPGRPARLPVMQPDGSSTFVIEEGKGEMKPQILDVVEQWLPELQHDLLPSLIGKAMTAASSPSWSKQNNPL